MPALAADGPVKQYPQTVTLGFYRGQVISYLDFGPVKLARAAAPIWVVTNGVDAQRNILDTVPGEPDDPAQLDFLQSAYAHIMGRTAYEGIAGSMTTSTDHPFADILNAGRKVVFSRTLKTADWANTTVAAGDTAEPSPYPDRLPADRWRFTERVNGVTYSMRPR